MKYFYVTGTSSGIGKALTEKILQNKNNRVIGISRNQSIEHPGYDHIPLDLSDLDAVKNFEFKIFKDSEEYILINNAGTLGDVHPAGQLNPDAIIQSYRVNTISPAILMNTFLKTYQQIQKKKFILNISSGAARHSVVSWSTYCSGKAALDMFSQVVHDEQKDQKHPAYIFSVAPGIVDTPMQDEIRAKSEDQFKEVGRFKEYKEKGYLDRPEHVTDMLIQIMNSPEKYSEILLDVRDF